MHPPTCPEWDYENVANFENFLIAAVKQILAAIKNNSFDTAPTIADTRPIHKTFFHDLVPADHSYFAGHYRGEDFVCLKYYTVGVNNDPRVGHQRRIDVVERDLFVHCPAGALKGGEKFVVKHDPILPWPLFTSIGHQARFARLILGHNV